MSLSIKAPEVLVRVDSHVEADPAALAVQVEEASVDGIIRSRYETRCV